ncbi:uncharacterized protein LTR77_010453 [Saxophila tyrrhenica]|uniref:Uncharacterized protein n=1 Tax=Saxophila tyrrhenica TaxID=1690608 RepID=A0AAV9NVX7_9PEZI|nr:hypothetical protein LTR77_010453 [Saxophila tyrrhenica]
MDPFQPHHFSPRLHDLLKNTDLQQLSRLPSPRLATTALPNIGLIELVSPQAFEKDYQPLYTTFFHGQERENPSLITARLAADFAGQRSGLAPYRVLGLRDNAGEAIGAAQFSVLFLPATGTGAKYAVPYLQYIYVRPQNRRQDLSEVLHTLVLAVATADAEALGGGRTVPFTLFESEPTGYGTTEASKGTATERAEIHARSGSRALMLRGQDGRVCSAHVQPGLEVGEGPLTLIWAIRPSPAMLEEGWDVAECGKALVEGYYRSLRDEGFPEENIAVAEGIVGARMRGREFFGMALANVTVDMYKADIEEM